MSIFLVLIVSAQFISTFLPDNTEPFITLAILGEERTADHYFPSDDSILRNGTTLPWHVYLYNHMGEAQYVTVKVKILRAGGLSPNSTICSPSNAPVVFELTRVVPNNETLLEPFTWSLLARDETSEKGSIINITKIKINEHLIDINIPINDGERLRIVFELWGYNQTSQEFTFKWTISGKEHSIWNQLWFVLES